MRRRIFIAINIDEKTKKFIDNKIVHWKEQLPLGWVPKENMHLTLAFVGYIEDQDLEEITTDLREKISLLEMFDIKMNKFAWGPKKERPKMFWLRGEKQKQLTELRTKIEEALSGRAIDKKEFQPHVNLARVIKSRLQDIQLPEIEEAANILIPVSSVDIMESVVEKGKRKYYVMERIELS